MTLNLPNVPAGFEVAHEEWLSKGGKDFFKEYFFSSAFYETGYWQLVRQCVLVSKNFLCCRCGGEASQVHHLNYDHIGEDHFYPENLAVVCVPCHGLVEYARLTESLVSRIERRISLCEGFIEDTPGCLSQSPAHVYERLLEYQAELNVLIKFFSSGVRYSDSRKSVEKNLAMNRRENKYEEQARIITAKWDGNEKKKAERLLPMLEAELANCYKFIEEVFAPVEKKSCAQS